MRRFLWLSALTAQLTLAALSAEAFDGIRVTLLGTGSFTPSIERFGRSTLVEAGDEILLFDCGRGAVQRLAQAGVRPADITGVFLTHLGADATVGLPDLWLTSRAQGRSDALPIYGPRGTVDMMRSVEQAFRNGIEVPRIEEAQATNADAHDIAENVVYRSEEVTVTAIVVER
ncbi:MAG: MBL fold metallo-hydrolase, partial [Proteobacteria bacterium]